MLPIYFVSLHSIYQILQMKKVFVVTAAVCAAFVLAACSEKKKSDDIIAPRVVKAKPQAPVRMQEYNVERDVEWIGKTYHVAIHRQPSDSLPMVKDDTGQKFVDNVFSLVVSRADGSVFFSRTFTKPAFNDYITNEFRKAGILEGLVFDKADGDWLEFAASVGLPQTDEYIPMIVRLSRMGQLVIKQDTQMDTNGDTGNDSQSDSNDDDI